VKLTQTEQRVVELYRRGVRPREIAEVLGISINTVYKALSKARKALGDVEPPREAVRGNGAIGQTTAAQASPPPRMFAVTTVSTTVTLTPPSTGMGIVSSGNSVARVEQPCPQLGELLEAVRRLEAEVAELKRMIRQQPPPQPQPSERPKLPDYIGANLWIDILRRR